MSRARALLFWWIRGAVDVEWVPPAIRSGPRVTGGVFLILVMIGFRDWLRRYRAQIVGSPQREAVAV